MKGRKPKTTHALRLAGSKRASGRADEPQFQGVPRRPDWLSPYAVEVWDRVVPDLVELGVTRRVDQEALVAYCEAASLMRKATEIIERDGMLVTTSKGDLRRHPAVGMLSEASATLARYSAEFGLTAASRSKVKQSKREASDGKSRFFSGPQAGQAAS